MINRFAQQLWQDLNELLQGDATTPKVSRSHFHSAVESALRKCQLVTREEFDAQQAVLARTREKIDAMEQQVIALESQLGLVEAPVKDDPVEIQKNE